MAMLFQHYQRWVEDQLASLARDHSDPLTDYLSEIIGEAVDEAVKALPTHTEEKHMIEVGKVVTQHRYSSTSWHDGPGVQKPGEWIAVAMGPGAKGIRVEVAESGSNGFSPASSSYQMLTPDQAVELGQLLMKAAESQVEYAKAAKELEEQAAKLDEVFKDRISGLGLKGDYEPLKAVEG